MLRLKRSKRGVWFSLLNDFKFESSNMRECRLTEFNVLSIVGGGGGGVGGYYLLLVNIKITDFS